MPAPVHNPAAQALQHMADTLDPQPPQHMADTPDPQPPQHTPAAAAATAARPRIRDQIAQNPLASLLGAVIVVLLGFNLTVTHDRINRIEDRITRFENTVDARFAQVDARFAQVDARFASLESGVAEINLKLTAFIAHLNATEAVDAALEGRLTGADTEDASIQKVP